MERSVLKSVAALLKLSIITGLQYRSNFILDIIGSLFRAFSAIAPIWLVYLHIDNIAGWSQFEVLIIMAIFLFYTGSTK